MPAFKLKLSHGDRSLSDYMDGRVSPELEQAARNMAPASDAAAIPRGLSSAKPDYREGSYNVTPDLVPKSVATSYFELGLDQDIVNYKPNPSGKAPKRGRVNYGG